MAGRLGTRLLFCEFLRFSWYFRFPEILSYKSFGNTWGNSYIPCLLLIITLLFIRGEMEILAKYQKVSQYYENYYSFVISLFFSLFFFFFLCFCFENLAGWFRVRNSEILTIFKMLLFNENCRFLYTCFKNFPSKKSANKMVINNRKKVKD